jgi:hypothetical protein
MPPPKPGILSALDLAAERLALSSFERRIVVMCAAIELEAGFDALCGLAHGDSSRLYPTFGLALGAFEDAHWSALAPTGPLRRFGLIEVQQGVPLTGAALRIDETFLHDLAGVSELNERLAAFVAPLARPDSLVPTQQRIAEEIFGILNLAAADGSACRRLSRCPKDCRRKASPIPASSP